jgi:ribonucleoside-diphosphate reductase alpha chain
MSDTFPAPISAEIWDKKYRLKTLDNEPVDITVEDTWRRIARTLAAVEERPDEWESLFYDALADFRFLPAGRIVAGAGSGRTVTMSNCFTMGTIPDNMAGIFEMLKEAALTMQQGGGIGYDFSTLRPQGAAVHGVGADASGPITFMDVWDAMCRTIMSAGSRRGAMMATMRCDHPDIFGFIRAKKDPNRLRMFNLSVLVTDAFMEAVEKDSDWELRFGSKVYGVISARDLWEEIMQSNYEAAEPGVIFIDRVNKLHNIGYIETIATTNPCGEKPMGPYSSCLLGSINLTKFVKRPFFTGADIDGSGLDQCVRIAIRMMDNVIEASRFPLPQQLKKAKEDRQLGLGVTGLADMLAMLGQEYGSRVALDTVEKVMKRIALAAYDESIRLAKEKGAFPNFDADKFLTADTWAGKMLPDDMQAQIQEHGIRNALLLSVAPTGTISLYAGNISSGIEPIFALSYTRKVLERDGTRSEQIVEDYAVKLYKSIFEELSKGRSNFVTAQTLPPSAHVMTQAVAQRWVDASISKTVNVPKDISFEEFKDIYKMAYDSGCKGCTTYRPNKVTGSVLSVTEKPEEEPPVVMEPTEEEPPAERPDTLPGAVYKLKWPGSDHALYITVTDIVSEDGKRRPFEVFINSKNMEHFAWTVALTRMISAIFRRPHNSRFVVEELKAVFDPKGGAWVGGRYVPSVLAAIGGVIETHMKRIGYMHDPELAAATESIMDKLAERKAAINPVMEMPYGQSPTGPCCPKCFSFSMKIESGCPTCLDCGYSKCG